MRLVLNPLTGILQPMPPATIAQATYPFPTDGAVDDFTLFTIPAVPAGAGRIILTRCIVRLSTALVGAGNCTIRVGSAVGGQQIVLDVVVNNATAVGVIAGETTASLGADMLPTQAFEAVYPAGQGIFVRLTPAGVVTAGDATFYLFGEWLP